MPIAVGVATLEEEGVPVAEGRRRGQSRRPLHKAFGNQEQAQPGRWLFYLSLSDARAALAPTRKSDATAHLAHDPVFLHHQHLPEDIARLFPEAIADPPRRGEEDLDPVDELQDSVPALQALRRVPFDGAGQDPKPATGVIKSRRKRAPTESIRDDLDSIYFAGGCEGRVSSDGGRSSRTH